MGGLLFLTSKSETNEGVAKDKVFGRSGNRTQSPVRYPLGCHITPKTCGDVCILCSALCVPTLPITIGVLKSNHSVELSLQIWDGKLVTRVPALGSVDWDWVSQPDVTNAAALLVELGVRTVRRALKRARVSNNEIFKSVCFNFKKRVSI